MTHILVQFPKPGQVNLQKKNTQLMVNDIAHKTVNVLSDMWARKVFPADINGPRLEVRGAANFS